MTTTPVNEVQAVADPLREMELWGPGSHSMRRPRGTAYYSANRTNTVIFTSEAAAWKYRAILNTTPFGGGPRRITWEATIAVARRSNSTHIVIWGMDPYNPIDVVEVAGL